MGLLDRFKRREGGADDGAQAARVQQLCELLRHTDWEQRAAAANELGDLGRAAQAAVPVLEEVISDDHGDVCLAASSALSRIRAASH